MKTLTQTIDTIHDTSKRLIAELYKSFIALNVVSERDIFGDSTHQDRERSRSETNAVRPEQAL